MIRPLHGYGTRKDGSGYHLILALTDADVQPQLVIELPVDARFQPILSVVIARYPDRATARAKLAEVTDSLGIETTVEHPKPNGRK